MKKITFSLVIIALLSANANAEDGYQHGWKVYDRPQPGASYGSVETNPYGSGGGKNAANPWHVADDE